MVLILHPMYHESYHAFCLQTRLLNCIFHSSVVAHKYLILFLGNSRKVAQTDTNVMHLTSLVIKGYFVY